ncbi:hypothetical protein C8J57DRAFT_968682, partial [Mycena rebaudengoi]
FYLSPPHSLTMPAPYCPSPDMSLPRIHDLFPDLFIPSALALPTSGSPPSTIFISLGPPRERPILAHLSSREQITDAYDTEKGHVCPMCSRQFSRPSGLRTHLYTHSGERPFHCPHARCHRAFNVKSNMLRHLRSHA